MRRPPKLVALGLLTLAASAGALSACSDATDATPDAGPDAAPTPTAVPTGSSELDASNALPDASMVDATDASDAAISAAPVLPESTQRVASAINPYGLTWGTDGHLYMSGATMVAGDRQLAVWRFDKTSNKLDTTFGSNGVLTLPLAGDETSYDILELKDGSFVVHAVSAGKVWLVKLTKDGSGAYAFGTPKSVVFGWEESDFASWPVAGAAPSYGSWGIALDRSNATAEKVVVFASGAPLKAATGDQRTDNDRWVARLLATDLSNDPSFHGGKPFSFDADGKNLGDSARRGIVEADGSIVSSGYTDFGTGPSVSVVLLRLKADGNPDGTFGFGTTSATVSPGQTKFNPFQASGGASEAYAVVKQSSGRYVTTGYGKSNFDTATLENDLLTFGLVRDNLDPRFGRLGAWAIQSERNGAAGLGTRPYRENGRDLVRLPDDRTLHVGCYDDFASLYVFGVDGKLDTSFGNLGHIQYPHAAPFFKVALSPDGKRVAASAQSVTDATLLVTLKVGN